MKKKKLLVNYLRADKQLFVVMSINEFQEIVNECLSEGIDDYLMNDYENELVEAYHLIGLPLLRVYDYFTKNKEWIQLNNEVKRAMNNVNEGVSFLRKRKIDLTIIASRMNTLNKKDYKSFKNAYNKLGLGEFIKRVYENISFIDKGKVELLDFEVKV